MGHYNKEYENYYKKVINTKEKIDKPQEENIIKDKDEYSTYIDKLENKKVKNNFSVLNNFINTIITTTIIAMTMLILLYIFKLYPETSNIYKYAKNIIASSLDYAEIISKYTKDLEVIATFDEIKKDKKETLNNEVENSIVKPFDGFVVVRKTIKESLKDNSNAPLDGKVLYDYNNGTIFKDYNVVASGESKEVKVIYDGIVKEIGKDDLYGEFIVIDHGEGIESKYTNLQLVDKKIGQELKSGEFIGKIIDDTKVKGVILQIIDNGNIVNPKEYLNFS